MTTHYFQTVTNTSSTAINTQTSAHWANNTGITRTSTTNSLIYPGTCTVTGSTIGQYWATDDSSVMIAGNIKITPGTALSIELPDGAVLQVLANGSYSILDEQAKVIYKANRVREFNRYLNGSDLLEEFIKFVSKVGPISKAEFFDLPIELFIQWLVIRAAEADGEDHDYAPVIAAIPLALPNPNKPHTTRCKCCGRFIHNRELTFCSAEHMTKYATQHNVFGLPQTVKIDETIISD